MIIKRGTVKVLSIIDSDYDALKEKEKKASMEKPSDKVKNSEKQEKNK